MNSPISTIVCGFIIVGFTCFGQPADKPVSGKKTTGELEAKLMAQFKAFAIRKRDYAKKIAAEKKSNHRKWFGSFLTRPLMVILPRPKNNTGRWL